MQLSCHDIYHCLRIAGFSSSLVCLSLRPSVCYRLAKKSPKLNRESSMMNDDDDDDDDDDNHMTVERQQRDS